MKTDSLLPWLGAFTLLAVGLQSLQGGEQVAIGIQKEGSQIHLTAPASISPPDQGQVFPEYTVQRSRDLTNWEPVGGKVRGISGVSGEQLTVTLPSDSDPGFYRVIVATNSANAQQTGAGGAEVFGYGSAFADELAKIGLLSVDRFAANWPQPAYLPQITWDPTTAAYWTNFNVDPAVWNATYSTFTQEPRFTDYRLSSAEMAIFMTNGFVVSERLSSPSFADSYYKIFTDDLPVFISADSVLQAWHRTYVEMLEEIEELQMATLLDGILFNMSGQVQAVWQQYGNGPLRDSILDANYYLCVARSLMTGQQVPCSWMMSSELSWQDAMVTTTLNAIKAERYIDDFVIFGTNRPMDFSQFKVRGHYTNSKRLGLYFQAMMWCGRVDLRLATFAPNKEDDIRQLGTAVVLNHLLKQSNQSKNWTAIENITRQFVGVTDSMTFAQLDGLLTEANIQSPADITSLATLTNLQTRLLTGELGVQSVRGDVFASPLSREQLKLPRSFTICGQKFAMDSWALSQVVFDSILWSPDEAGKVVDGKVWRRKPSCLDVAFSVFGNDQMVPDLVARINNTNGLHFRDGLPYQHNLTAVRKVIDGQDASIWTNNIYTAWIAALRALSAPTVDSKYPEVMRTRAWANKTLNTQLASWTELRHDTVLYVKQSYTSGAICSYPAGFVEPRPEFWQRMADMAQLTAGLISNLSLSGTVSVPSRASDSGVFVNYDIEQVGQNQITCLTNFAAKMRILKSISDKELAQQQLSQTETDFFKNTVERIEAYTAGMRSYTGWYPGLFYRNAFKYLEFGQNEGSDLWDAMVTDVHTDPPDDQSADPGAVIHEGVGHVHLLMIAVDNGPDRMVYAGPVLSHYEFEMPGITRMSDEEWKANLRNGQKPASPEWTRSYLVPAAYTLPEGY